MLKRPNYSESTARQHHHHIKMTFRLVSGRLPTTFVRSALMGQNLWKHGTFTSPCGFLYFSGWNLIWTHQPHLHDVWKPLRYEPSGRCDLWPLNISPSLMSEKPGRTSVINNRPKIKMFSWVEPANYANLFKCVNTSHRWQTERLFFCSVWP